jgi:aryl-alcohol dehydrogenase-like predicted oxidoreductase
MPLTTLAMAWILDKPEVTCAIIGPSRPEQLDDVISAMDTELPVAVKDQVDTLTKTWRNDSV